MGAAGSVREDSLPDRTSRSVRTKFSFNPPLDGFSSNAEVVSKAITDRNKVVAVDNASKVKTTTKDICHSQVEVDYVTDVEKFSKDVFERSHIIDGQHIIHLSESGRLSFMSFLKKEYTEENHWFFNAIHETRKNLLECSEYYSEDVKNIIISYLPFESAAKVGVTGSLKQSLEHLMLKGSGFSKDQVLASLSNAQDEAMTIVAAGALPRYLLSTYYIDWCSTESHQSTGSIAANTVESKVDEVTKELDRIFISSNWLREMLAAVEHIPICITVAAASRAMPGFPLLYVNSAFESTTGYTRQEIIGQNCRFLQLGKLDGEVAEQESISRLSYALSEAKPVRVAITNYRKDGTSFSNLLAMKPIMDEDGNYAFVLGIQCDIGAKGASAAKLKMIDDLFHLLPDTIIAVPQIDGNC